MKSLLAGHALGVPIGEKENGYCKKNAMRSVKVMLTIENANIGLKNL